MDVATEFAKALGTFQADVFMATLHLKTIADNLDANDIGTRTALLMVIEELESAKEKARV